MVVLVAVSTAGCWAWPPPLSMGSCSGGKSATSRHGPPGTGPRGRRAAQLPAR